MIHDGVELPSLLRVTEAAAILTTSEAAIRQLVADRELQSIHINGILHIVTDSIADRVGERTPSRHNQDCE